MYWHDHAEINVLFVDYVLAWSCRNKSACTGMIMQIKVLLREVLLTQVLFTQVWLRSPLRYLMSPSRAACGSRDKEREREREREMRMRDSDTVMHGACGNTRHQLHLHAIQDINIICMQFKIWTAILPFPRLSASFLLPPRRAGHMRHELLIKLHS